MRIRLLRWLLLSPRAVARGDYRHLRRWCDYGRQAHERVRFYAYVGGRIWGQSCRRHAPALARDLLATAQDRIHFCDVGPMTHLVPAGDHAPVGDGGP